MLALAAVQRGGLVGKGLDETVSVRWTEGSSVLVSDNDRNY